jgi:EAL domain-containing protein (putative c-di-GMP-specific phosphodiesterase class I)
LLTTAGPRKTTPGFVRGLADIIDEFGIHADSVCLEISDRALVRDIETTRRTLAELKEVGLFLVNGTTPPLAAL